MAMLKYPYELSVWKEELNGSNSKIEEKGVIIGAHDMTYLGKATNIVLNRKFNGTNTLTFQMPDKYYDPASGSYFHNELIDYLYTECKIKLFYKDKWYEFFIKKSEEKKQFKSYMISFTCTDAFIDELSRNGYGITFDTELYNNVQEIGIFTEETLKDSIWKYHPENNWGDFTEFQEEKLYKVPISQFGGHIDAYKLNFNLDDIQLNRINEKYGTDIISNIYNPEEEREVELSDDLARECFWDEKIIRTQEDLNKLFMNKVENIPNDGYIYVPYSCLNFCYGQEKEPAPDETITYDHAATEVALKNDDNQLVIAPPSVDPRTIIQFIAFPENAILEIDEAGVILNKEYQYIISLEEWNNAIAGNLWYIFEDIRMVEGEPLGPSDVKPTLSHTFKYLKTISDQTSDFTLKYKGNKVVIYDGYLNNLNNNFIIKGKKYSITDRSELNISDEIDQYVTVYNNDADEYKDMYQNDNDWIYTQGETTKNGQHYRVCSKIDTRQIVPQLARNLIQNGIKIKSTDGWAPMNYVNKEKISSGNISLIPAKKFVSNDSQDDDDNIEQIDLALLSYMPPRKAIAQEYQEDNQLYYCINGINNKIYTKPTPVSNVFQEQPNESLSGKTYKGIYYINAQYNENTNKYQFIQSIQNWDNVEHTYKTPEEIINIDIDKDYFGFINFGIVGQEKKIEKNKIYCLGLKMAAEKDDFSIKIGKGSIVSSSTYTVNNPQELKCSDLYNDFKIAEADFWTKLDNNEEIDVEENINESYILFRAQSDIENPYFIIETSGRVAIQEVYFFEAYTKGRDCFAGSSLRYAYSGRDLFGCEQPDGSDEWNDNKSKPFSRDEIKNLILFEDDVMPGQTYGYQKYFIQRLKTKDSENNEYYDTMGVKEYTTSDADILNQNADKNILPLDAAKYNEDDYEIQTNYINMSACTSYVVNSEDGCDCNYNGKKGICFYQKYGYCPHMFTTEKHCRPVRTLSVSKSNRFNIIQTISKIFQAYPQFYIAHEDNGVVVKEKDKYDKRIFFIKEKGVTNDIGFRYEKNLKDISRSIVSDQIVTKLYVLDVDSELSKTGLCSIKLAEDNISKDNYIIDLSYYIEKGSLDADEVEQDLYGLTPITLDDDNIDQIPSGFLSQLGYYNGQYDRLSNNIINLQDASFNELETNLIVNIEGIATAQKEINKLKKQLDAYSDNLNTSGSSSKSQVEKNYEQKIQEQSAILSMLVDSLFFTDNSASNTVDYSDDNIFDSDIEDNIDNVMKWFGGIKDLDEALKDWRDNHTYDMGILGQYNKEYEQIQAWKKERASYLKLINQISSAFYKKYEPYLKEGTWSDSNYLTDNAYYFGALDVAAQGAIPKVSYNISVIDIQGLSDENKDLYNFDLFDTTYIEDIGMFGINEKTGLPNRLKVIISECQDNLDDQSKNSIKVQNFTTQFEDLFQQVTASVQSLTYNENIYKRSSNFTSLHNVEKNSLQGTLDTNDLTLINTDEGNIKVDNTGTSGSDINNHANKYKLKGEGMYFSNNGGQSYNVGVGPNGINADYINVGMLDAGKIRIADSSYVYFSWDKNGIAAYRDPIGINTNTNNINDMAVFNKYGLSIVKDGHIKLRAGYSYNGSSNVGEINSEQDQSDQIGFYLFNNQGDIIFETTEENEGARLSLIGEMYVGNHSVSGTIISDQFTYWNGYYVESYSCYELGNDLNNIDWDPVNGGQGPQTRLYNCDIGSEIELNGEIYKKISMTSQIVYGCYQDYVYKNIVYYTIQLIKMDTSQEPHQEILGSDITKYIAKITSQTNIDYICSAKNITTIKSVYGNQVSGEITIEYNFPAISQTDVYDLNTTKYSSEYGIPCYIKGFPNNAQTLYNDTRYPQDITKPIHWINVKTDYGGGGIEGSTALYLNNTQAPKESSAAMSERLFVACKNATVNNQNIVRNLFAILKGGQLYIGGIINSGAEDGAEKLKREITIKDAGIYIDGNSGLLKMDFSNLYDTNGQNLTDQLGGKSSSGHYHRINNKLVTSIDNPEFNIFDGDELTELPDTIKELLEMLNERLYFNWHYYNYLDTGGPIG